MPYKSKRQKTLIKNLLNVLNCVSLLRDELNDSKFNSQINTTIENDIKLAENIEIKLSLEFLN